jgi:hypothetical protein
VEQLAAEDNGEPDAPADPDEDEVGDPDGGAVVLFGDGGQVDVVFEHDRPVEVGP